MSEIKPRYLVMVTASANNNKYYKQIPHGDTWTAEYGRIGSSSQRREYPMSQWNSKYNEKIRKGYVDQSDLVEDLIQVQKPKQSEYKEIENKVIAEIVERLQEMAKQAISDNYTISSNKVTQAMVDEAQEILTGLLDIPDVDTFNDMLLKLFTVIPRRMGNVKDYLVKSTEDFAKIIQREQDLLDVMRGQVVQKQIMDDTKDNDDNKNENTILEQLGLEFDECNDKDIAVIKDALGSCADRFYKAWKVKNIKTQERFEKFVKENNIKSTKLLFHGSRNENWWSIINTGLVLKPTNAVITGKMFGYGIYYAPKARKSLGYTSLDGSYWVRGNSKSGFMALMDVAYGKPYDVYSFDSKYYNFNYDRLQEACNGANCLHAHEGSMLRNDEIIVYKEDQCTIRYLIELR
ncbi:Poly(ADP-ribose) polymerase catalytic domain [uncultured Clostridium sp.]|nr:Poly(ADP-ribose) polymerase catalytic domain [uncultured Clostridium sp.]